MTAPAEPILASTLWTLHLATQDTTADNPVPGHKRHSTGLPSLDGALEGGFDYGSISCISAEPNSGSGDIMLAVLVSHLLSDLGATATVIDITLSFDLRRLHGKLVHALQLRGRDTGEAMSVLERLKIMKIFDFVGLTESVVEVRESLEGHSTYSPAHVLRQAAPRGTVGDSEDEDEMLDAPTLPSTVPRDGSKSTLNLSLLIIDSISQVAAPLIKSNYVQALGKTFAYMLDLHLLVHVIPKTAADARRVYGSKHEGKSEQEAELVEVIEVLQDRHGSRVGKWTALTLDTSSNLAELL
ncbi:hypothetical protein LTR48_001141 [Friedmanniomyces endolithicus]|uniref:DNA recombination and repair protein Rad51-like C-terminal domain-containing protein n=1 Tax=Rachicladosporium monterosium TaxID=1507873 RepID=A0ABR0LBT0_9PEZI|nr:hypothetical protein LTR48_001141 [Friedmanniomyces endolithicus]KAK5146496.1 hypothetical protein LTR32_001917 [Rachicladosporium monterosium]